MKKRKSRKARRNSADARVKVNPLFRGVKQLFEKACNGSEALDRAEIVKQLRDAGHSARAIARAVGRDVGTILRDLKVANLPADDKDRLRAGRSGNHVLRANRRKLLEAASRQREQNERLTHQESDKLAEVLVQELEATGLAERVVADQLLGQAEHEISNRRHSLSGVFPSARLSARQVFHEEQKRADTAKNDADPLDSYFRILRWVVRSLMRIAPCWPILERTLALARDHFHQAALRPSKRLSEEDFFKALKAELANRRAISAMGAERLRPPDRAAKAHVTTVEK